MAKSTLHAIFYSTLLTRIETLPQGKAPATQWIGTIVNLTGKGVEEEEIARSGATASDICA